MDQVFETKHFQRKLPKSLIWTGILIIVGALMTLFLVAWLMEYSDKIIGNITLTTPNMPLGIPTKSDGTLQFFVENNDSIQENQMIALIENTASYADVLLLEKSFDNSKIAFQQAKEVVDLQTLQLGTLQTSVTQINEAVSNYNNFSTSNQQTALIASKRKSIQLYRNRLKLLQKKDSLSKQDVALAEKQTLSKRRLADSKTIAEAEFDRSLQEKIGKEFDNLSNEEASNTIEIQIAALKEEMIEIQSQNKELLEGYEDAIKRALVECENQIAQWKNQYLILANRNGQVVWSEYLSNGEYVQTGQMICTLLPLTNVAQIGKVEIAMDGASKVRIGQQVNILLANYPPNEFGILKGEVAQISSLPENGILKVEVALPKDLVSTYGITFDFQQLATGRAEIITNKMSFAQRIWNEAKGRRLN